MNGCWAVGVFYIFSLLLGKLMLCSTIYETRCQPAMPRNTTCG